MQTLEPIQSANTNFDRSGYFAIGLIGFTILGFWPSFFSKYLDGTADFNAYFHFHGAMATAWMLMLIIQPILIRKKKMTLHKTIGKFSYLLLPMFFISVILLKHQTLAGIVPDQAGARLWVQTKDIVIMSIMFGIAIRYKRNLAIHARAMIATGIVFIEPILVRFFSNVVFKGVEFPIGFLLTIGLMYGLMIVLMIAERKQAGGRWVFPLLMGLYLLFHSFVIFGVSFSWWDAFARWFIKLPLT